MSGRIFLVWALAGLAAACGSEEVAPADGGFDDAGVDDAGVANEDAAVAPDASSPDAASADAAPADATCPEGTRCNPIRIAAFPYSDTRDTREAQSDELDRYSCAPNTDESGAEFIYAFELAGTTRITATVDDLAGDEIDIDLNLLSSLDAAACLERDNTSVTIVLGAGTYYLTADTWMELAGPYQLDVTAQAINTGTCAMMQLDLEMYWTSCAPNISCFEANGNYYLTTPAVGPVVKEAHLVTVDEEFPNIWPTSFTDEIQRHYQLSEARSGYVMSRGEPWAPAGEGGSEYGQGSTGGKVPVLEEAWYINMYWRHRPALGTRMIVRNPANGRTVVAAAGLETGPGSNTAIGGVAEEIHDYLGTGHRDTLELGFAVDDTLPLGPIICP